MKKHTEILIALPLAYQDGADKYLCEQGTYRSYAYIPETNGAD